MQDRGAAPIQRMSQGEIGLNPTKPVLVQRKLPERRRGGPQRVHGGADVVCESGQSQLRRTGAAPDRFLGLENDHTQAGGGKLYRGGEPVGARPDDDRVVAQSCLSARKGFAIKRKGVPIM